MTHHFFLPGIKSGRKAVLTGPDGHHAVRVLRLKAGEEVTLADGCGKCYRAEVVALKGGTVELNVLAELPGSEAPIEVILLQGLPKGDKMDFIIEKCTELGVGQIWVLQTERVIPKLDAAGERRRLSRWRRKAEAAACQSRRGRIPVVEGLYDLETALARLAPDTFLLVPWEKKGGLDLRYALDSVAAGRPLAVLIGPEGGLSEREVEKARQAGGLVVSLGPRILRTETAGLVCLAAIMYELGDLGCARR
ncbi:MAG: rRNA (uracil1498-N3)-methyltransferase [Clostridia bacterium]|nr:rRNA (uracil1498-N3)-methyltransferase [Clostridia bacterium]